jgi:hypothetical protein
LWPNLILLTSIRLYLQIQSHFRSGLNNDLGFGEGTQFSSFQMWVGISNLPERQLHPSSFSDQNPAITIHGSPLMSHISTDQKTLLALLSKYVCF